jgi:hypothetical protein
MPDNENKKISRDLKRILCASTLSVVILIGVMIFSPLASQFDDDGLSRGAASEWELDSLLEAKEYQSALVRVDSIIADKKCGLPRFAYFDRFLSEQERYDASVARTEIYDLQWKRIEILRATRDEAILKSALEDYAVIIGYNQERAKALLKQIKEERQ